MYLVLVEFAIYCVEFNSEESSALGDAVKCFGG